MKNLKNVKRLFDKEITKNLLKENSCNNCKISMMSNFSAGTNECEVKIVVVSVGRLKWIEPNLRICKNFV